MASFNVGQNPADIIQEEGFLYVSKKSYTSENLLAVINSITGNVQKVFFNTPPVSAASNGLVYVSTYSGKKIFLVDTTSTAGKIDSIDMNIPEPAIGDIIAGDSRTIYVLGVSDTMFSANVGRTVYKIDIINKTVNTQPIITAEPDGDIYGISYDYVNDRIYIMDSKNGLQNGQVRVYNKDGGLLKTFNIGGKYPKRAIVKYENG
jgi:outer membrane protein assembly factor BamB